MTHREQYTISTGRSRLETAWRERRVSWPWLCDRLNQVLRTAETAQEYASMRDTSYRDARPTVSRRASLL